MICRCVLSLIHLHIVLTNVLEHLMISHLYPFIYSTYLHENLFQSIISDIETIGTCVEMLDHFALIRHIKKLLYSIMHFTMCGYVFLFSYCF